MESGFLSGIFAFIFWGFVTIYWKELPMFDAYELLGHRIIWGIGTIFCFFLFTRPIEKIKSCLDSKTKRIGICLSAALIFSNWFVFVWAIGHGHVLETSIGYFLNPLISVALGVLVLGENLRLKQKVSVGLAFFGMIILFLSGVGNPFISLFLAFSFALYGLVRKKLNIPAIEGLFLEMLICLIPFLIFFVLREESKNISFFKVDLYEQILVVFAGLVTLTPLIAFNHSVKKIPLSTIGLLQYIAPSLQFLLAVFVYKEDFTNVHVFSFIFIWSALLLFSYDLISLTKIQRVAND
ncbi:hypothetical protein A9Q84_02060 [Halobacteriovorax marinus]|uniref:EamA domain-containing protein n=1 Tax=Halobacteriovorax marinus TaxID=97084 RepID=A0A1Y5FI10_9BACT|nr:hypothetical protein A9Q84_02060 [Halobacteriovorax marinus]